jgi:hypothetical protein
MPVATSPDNRRQVRDLMRGRSPLTFRIDEELSVNSAIRTFLAGLIVTGFAVGMAGCSDESSSKTQTEVKTPGGTATITEKTTVSKSGNNPPPVNEPLKNP